MLKVHKIIEGPYEYEDFYVLECYGEIEEGKFEVFTLSNYELDIMYDIVRHMKKPTLEPYVLE